MQGVLCESRTWLYAQEGADNVMRLSVKKMCVRVGEMCPSEFAKCNVFLSSNVPFFCVCVVILPSLCGKLQIHRHTLIYWNIKLHVCRSVLILSVEESSNDIILSGTALDDFVISQAVK